MKHLQTFESFIFEGVITVTTSKYKTVHGKEPSGNGMWAFEIGGGEVFTPKSMSFADAKKWAIEQAKEKGVNVINVLG
jgi:hypothetical protein